MTFDPNRLDAATLVPVKLTLHDWHLLADHLDAHADHLVSIYEGTVPMPEDYPGDSVARDQYDWCKLVAGGIRIQLPRPSILDLKESPK